MSSYFMPTANTDSKACSDMILQDFPSLGQLNEMVVENNIYPIFAVTEKPYAFYLVS